MNTYMYITRPVFIVRIKESLTHLHHGDNNILHNNSGSGTVNRAILNCHFEPL